MPAHARWSTTSSPGAARRCLRKPVWPSTCAATAASSRNQAEAEFVQNLLRDAGVPSVLRRSAGADVPDFLAAGRRDVLVPASLAEIARDALTPADRGPSAS